MVYMIKRLVSEYKCMIFQVYLFYGARSNCEFFIHSGFVYMESAWDRLPLKLGKILFSFTNNSVLP